MLIDHPKIEFCSILDFAQGDYSIVGDGGYVVSLIDLIKRTHGNLPKSIYVNKHNENLPQHLQRSESEISKVKGRKLILGSNLFQLEMLQRLAPQLDASNQIYDVAAAKGNTDTMDLYLSDEPTTQDYVLFIGVNPLDNVQDYLSNFVTWLAEQGIHWVVRHPLQSIEDELIASALGVLIWNGAMSIHQPLVKKCDALKINLTYVECGFFPQSQYFYLDRCGVNNESQLYHDDLDWVNAQMVESLEQVTQSYYANPIDSQFSYKNYVFVPLQVPSDSNVLKHSRFTHGMQEFIDFIEQQYPNELVIFKPHPKDRLKDVYQYKRGLVSNESILTLISHAKVVHGINSSVLYEAVLMNKPVVVEGDCLLAQHQEQPLKLLAAMCFRQFDVSEKQFSVEKLQQFSFMNIALNSSTKQNDNHSHAKRVQTPAFQEQT